MPVPRMTRPKAVVLLSGGMDSAVTALIAQRDGFDVHALSVRYGQRHAVELDAARRGATETVAQLAAFTSGSAYVNHLDTDTGTLEVGRLADLAVLDRDPQNNLALQPGAIIEPVVSVESFISEIFVSRTVKIVCACTCDELDLRAWCSSKLRSITGGLDLELLECVDRYKIVCTS